MFYKVGVLKKLKKSCARVNFSKPCRLLATFKNGSEYVKYKYINFTRYNQNINFLKF